MRQAPRILRVPPVDHIGDRRDGRAVVETDRQAPLQIGRRRLFPFAQVRAPWRRASGAATRKATPWQRPPRSSPSTRPGLSGVPRWTCEKTQSERW